MIKHFAPEPKRAGMSQLIYGILRTMDRPISAEDIYTLLPEDVKSVSNKKTFYKNLENCAYRGFLIGEGPKKETRMYRIADYNHYSVLRNKFRARVAKSKKKAKQREALKTNGLCVTIDREIRKVEAEMAPLTNRLDTLRSMRREAEKL